MNFGITFALLNSSSKMFDIKPQCHLEVPLTISQYNAGFDSVTRYYLDDILEYPLVRDGFAVFLVILGRRIR